MQDAERPLIAQEVLARAQVHVPRLGIATVYRNLKSLHEEGWLRSVELPGEPMRYELAAMKHHHHFHCEQCGRVFDIPGCTAGLDTNVPQNFLVTRHEVVLYGQCAECRASSPV